MKRIRIGNDITIKWTINRQGLPEDFSGKAISVYLLEPFSNSKATINYTIENNIITIYFNGKDQKKMGQYTLKLVENEGKTGMITLDHCNPFTLVAKSCMTGGNNQCSNIVVETIELTSSLDVGKDGKSAYEIALSEGFKGSEAEWLESLKQPSIDAAAVANEATELANKAVDNTNQVILQSQEQTKKALKATNTANAAATNANEKAKLVEEVIKLANKSAETAEEKASLANEAATKADNAASKADTSAANADEKATLANEAANNANTAADNANETANNPTYIGEDNYVYVYNKETKTYDKTDIFTRGKDFDIEVVYKSVAELIADTTAYKDGLFALINTDDVEDPDNARLYVRRNGAWHFLIDMSGAIGFTGKTPQITIGVVISGESASASLSPNGTDDKGNPKFLLNLVLPKGDKGDTGEKGDKGDTGEKGDAGYIYTPSVDDEGNLSWSNNGGLENPEIKNIRGPQGIQGEQGPQGETGPQGEKGETYDDTQVQEAITSLRNALNALIGGDTTSAIDNFNEVVAFLKGIEDSENLESIIAAIEKQIAAKQDSISDLATIRDGAAKGATALQSYTEKYTGTYSKPSGGIPKSDLDSVVQESLGKADTALQEHQDISKKIDGDGTITKIVKVSELPDNPDANTLYIIV